MSSISIGLLAKEAIYTLLQISAPVLAVALGVGLIISIIQTVTQIQESTISFIPKLLAVSLSLIALASWMISKLQLLADHAVQFITQLPSL